MLEELRWQLTQARKCYVIPTFSGVPNTKRGEENRIGCLTPALSGAQERAEMLRHPCIVRGPQPQAREENQKLRAHPFLLGGPKEGEISTSPLAFSGVPNAMRGKEMRSGYLTPSISGAQKHRCILGGPKTKERNQKLPFHRCLLGSLGAPQVGGNAVLALHSWGSPMPSAGRKSEVATSPLPPGWAKRG